MQGAAEWKSGRHEEMMRRTILTRLKRYLVTTMTNRQIFKLAIINLELTQFHIRVTGYGRSNGKVMRKRSGQRRAI